MLEEELKAVGLSEKEAQIYSAVLAEGKVTPARVADMTGINRTTVYAVGKVLVAQGFLLADDLKGVTYYYPTPPKDLVKITKRERQALIEKELAIEELAKAVGTLPQSKKYSVPKLKFVEHEEKVAQYLYDNVLRWQAGTKGDEAVWYGFQDATFVAHEPYQEWIRWYWPQALPETELKLFSNNTQAENDVSSISKKRQIKTWVRPFVFEASQWVLGDYSILVMTKQKPHYLVELHDAVYADNMRKLFKNLWEEIK